MRFVTTMALALVLTLVGVVSAGHDEDVTPSDFVSLVDGCIAQGPRDNSPSPFAAEDDPQRLFFSARLALQCGLQVAEDLAVGQPQAAVPPPPRELNKIIRRTSSALRRLDKVPGQGGTREAKALKKLHAKLADPTGWYGNSRAFRSASLFVGTQVAGEIERFDGVLADLVADFDTRADDTTTKGAKRGLKFAALARLLLEEAGTTLLEAADLQNDVLDERLHGVPEKKLKKSGKRARSLTLSAHDALIAAIRTIDKAERAFQKELERQARNRPCILTNPDNPFQGGGTVTLSIDGGEPMVLDRGTMGLSIFSKTRRFMSFGTRTGVYPRVIFLHEGKHLDGRGSTPLANDPFDKHPVRGKAHLVLDREGPGTDFYTSTSGWYRFDSFNLKKRIAIGAFEATVETDDGRTATIAGTFELCGFQIETKKGIR